MTCGRAALLAIGAEGRWWKGRRQRDIPRHNLGCLNAVQLPYDPKNGSLSVARGDARWSTARSKSVPSVYPIGRWRPFATYWAAPAGIDTSPQAVGAQQHLLALAPAYAHGNTYRTGANPGACQLPEC